MKNLYHKLYRYFKGIPHPDFLRKKYPHLMKPYSHINALGKVIPSNQTLMEYVVFDYCNGRSIDFIMGTTRTSRDRIRMILRKAERFEK